MNVCDSFLSWRKEIKMRKAKVFLTAAGRLFGGGGNTHSPGTGIERFALPASETDCLLWPSTPLLGVMHLALFPWGPSKKRKTNYIDKFHYTWHAIPILCEMKILWLGQGMSSALSSRYLPNLKKREKRQGEMIYSISIKNLTRCTSWDYLWFFYMWMSSDTARNNNAIWAFSGYEKFFPKTVKREGKPQVFLSEVLHENTVPNIYCMAVVINQCSRTAIMSITITSDRCQMKSLNQPLLSEASYSQKEYSLFYSYLLLHPLLPANSCEGWGGA